GTDRDATVADYAASQQNLAGEWADGMLHMISSLGVPLSPELTTLVTGTPSDAMTKTLEWLDAHHGGAASYLQTGGLTDAELDALRARLRA
ncbi:MAG TPA: tyrosine-protein phosphatase, partial [Microbacterium sp.]|nr:tyrosine-protein phosphatase [Microbacterium sp.]